MTQKKHIPAFILLFLTGIIALSPITIRAIELPTQIQNAQIYAQQRAKFAKVMALAIAKYFWQQPCAHTLIEEKLAQIYGPAFLPTPESIKNDVKLLYTAIIENILLQVPYSS